MRFAVLATSAALAAALALEADDARACGGCFVPATESTQVSGHRMALSLSKTQTTLWDQIKYAGEPSSFAWVLPTVGVVEVALSSDALFEQLENLTQVTISPKVCPSSSGAGGAMFSTSSSSSSSSSGGVVVLAQQTVGPYETVQLSASDPTALMTWLLSHGYEVPPDIAPVIDAYVAEGFDFLAMKLVPGQGIASMRPVRITSPGAAPVLPLRMVAAGTGAITPVVLFVVSEGRYVPANFPTFQIDEAELEWDFATSSSNYSKLVADGFAALDGHGWLCDAAEPKSAFAIRGPLEDLAVYNPIGSGYGDADGVGAFEECQADLDDLVGPIAQGSLWLSRMRAELSREALGDDLVLAASDQGIVKRSFIASAGVDCAPVGNGTGGAPGATSAGGAAVTEADGADDEDGCNVDSRAPTGGRFAAMLLLSLAVAAGARRLRRAGARRAP